MRILKIDTSKGMFLNSTGIYQPIDEINKEDLIYLMSIAVENEDTEMDDSTTSDIVNPAQKIIYDNIRRKLMTLQSQRTTIISNKTKLYQAAIEKYSKNSQ
jgi:hypothetical protein